MPEEKKPNYREEVMPEQMSAAETNAGCWVFVLSLVVGFLANPMFGFLFLGQAYWPYWLLGGWIIAVLVYARLTNKWWPLPKPIDRLLKRWRKKPAPRERSR